VKSVPDCTQFTHGILNSHCGGVRTFSKAQKYIRMVILVPIISVVTTVNLVVALVSLPSQKFARPKLHELHVVEYCKITNFV
jgi:hypothetical protein